MRHEESCGFRTVTGLVPGLLVSPVWGMDTHSEIGSVYSIQPVLNILCRANITMNKRKTTEADERMALIEWKRALMSMDSTLKSAQTQVRQLERVVRTIQGRVGVA